MKNLSLALLATFLTVASASAATPSPSTPPLPPIKVSDNGRFFVKEDATPFFWLGDTAWSIFNHPTPADVDFYMDDRKAKGFTVIQGCIALWDYRTRRNPDGQIPFINGDPAQINDAFFKNVDNILDKAASHGLYMAVLPFWTKNTRTGAAADPATMKKYCHYLAARYAARNVFWVLGGDTAGTDIQPVTDAEAEGLLAGAKEAGVSKIMITFHPTGRQSSSFWFQERPWLDFDAIQSGHFINTTNFQIVAADYAKKPVKPTLDMEPGYENITNNLVRDASAATAPRIQAVDVRRGAYLAVFAGAAGHTYGNGEVYEFWQADRAAAMPGWGSNLPWRDSLKLPASGQVQFVRWLIESRPMLQRIPDQSLLAGTASNRALDRIEATRADDGTYAFVYLPAGQSTVTVNTAKLSGTQLAAWWYDPRTGVSAKIDQSPKTDTRTFTVPAPTDKIPATQNDWVLVLDDAAKNFSEPGKH
ncbi:MAG TPA: glycoside hydrolase family 140 protein [Phycisphaerae bacterium]